MACFFGEKIDGSPGQTCGRGCSCEVVTSHVGSILKRTPSSTSGASVGCRFTVWWEQCGAPDPR